MSKILKIFQNTILVFITGMILFMPAMVVADSLDDLLREQDQLEAEIRRNQAIINQKGQSIKDLQSQLAVMDAQIAETQAKLNLTYTQIEITEKEITSLEVQITDQQNKLDEQKNILWAGISVLYKEKDTSLMETILSSENFSDVMNRNFYLSSIEDQVIEAMDEIIEIRNKLAENKKDLEIKQTDLIVLAQKQETEKRNLALTKGAKSDLLFRTQGEQAQYKNLVSKLQNEAGELSEEIYELRKEQGGGEDIDTGGSGGYPYTQIHAVDPWKFLTRECTSYAAWYWNMKIGKSWTNTRPGSGSAYNWPNMAYDYPNSLGGYSVSNTSRVGAIISWSSSDPGNINSGNPCWWGSGSMPCGHVAIVRSVNSNNTIDVSEYNWVKYSYSYRSNVNPWAYGTTPRYIY
ncbi:MAG: CHAP domain-containing protein [bacterium]